MILRMSKQLSNLVCIFYIAKSRSKSIKIDILYEKAGAWELLIHAHDQRESHLFMTSFDYCLIRIVAKSISMWLVGFNVPSGGLSCKIQIQIIWFVNNLQPCPVVEHDVMTEIH